MRPSVSLITLGVRDFRASLTFYKDKLGWPTDATPDDPVAFFKMNGVVLGLFSREELAKDAAVKNDGDGFDGITLAQNVGSPQEVDDMLKTAERAGATIVKRGEKTPWGGYNGYFADPDGHLWEIAHNPFWKLNDDGSVDLHA